MDANEFTVAMAMGACGLGPEAAARIATQLFRDDFRSCKDKSDEELRDSYKTFASFTQAQGQIRLQPLQKDNIKAFNQWVKDQYRLGLDPTRTPFPVERATALIERAKSHAAYVANKDSIAVTAKPEKFSKDMKWEDWSPSFVNFLRAIPGRDGVPLKYVIRDNEQPDPTPNVDFLDDYVMNAPLEGQAFVTDSAIVHTYLINLIAQNTEAEAIVKLYERERNGRKDWKALKLHYEGQGMYSTDIAAAESDIDNLFYSGERPPHMDWSKFERRLNVAFHVYQKREGREVFSDAMKLRTLLKKIRCEWLKPIKTSIDIELSRGTSNYSYNEALLAFRTEVNKKFPPGSSASRIKRTIQELDRSYNNNNTNQRSGRNFSGRGGRGRGRFASRGRGFGRGRGGGRGRGRGRGGRGYHNNYHSQESKWITLRDGQQIEYHPAWRFDDHIYEKFTDEQKDMLRRERQAHAAQQGYGNNTYNQYGSNSNEQARRTIQELQAKVDDLESRMSVPGSVQADYSAQISQVTGATTMFGGRNEQANKRARNSSSGSSGRSIGSVKTTRRIASVAANHLEPSQPTTADNECDTNADTCCLGKNFIIMEYTQRTADVYSFEKDAKPTENIPIVSGATAWDDPDTGETYILIINEALYYGTKLDHSLINPNQMRSYGIDLWDNPFDNERGLELHADSSVIIKLKTRGTKILFESRSPTAAELRDCHHIELTSKSEWNPSSVSLIKKLITRDRPALYPYGMKEDLLNQLVTISEVTRYDESLEDLPTKQTYTSTERHAKVSAEVLADRFAISEPRARQTLAATMQKGTRSAILPISRRYRADRRFGVKRLRGKFSTDTLWAKTKSLLGNTCTQIYSHKCGFNVPYHMERANNKNVGYSLRALISDYGAPEHLTYDGAAVQVGRHTSFQDTIKKHDISHHVSGPRRPNENPVEGSIREIKKRWYRLQAKKNVPDRLWDYGIRYICETGNVMTNSSRYSNGRVPLECITGETPDISEYMDFGFYDWVSYRNNAGLGPPELGRWLGVSHRVGQQMSYWILTHTGNVISCVTVQRVTNLERKTDETKAKMKAFEAAVKQRWDAQGTELTYDPENPPGLLLSLDDEDEDFIKEYTRVINNKDIKDIDYIDINELGEIDPYLNMELGLQREEEGIQRARVKRRALDDNGRPIGKANNNPILDSRLYEVEYLDGRIEALTANIIAENLLAQVDEHGHRHMLLQDIEDHRTTKEAIRKEDGFYVTKSGLKKRIRTTKGWEIYVRWKDGSGDWVALKDLKESYPVQLAEYAIQNDIQHEPAFAWWIPYTIRKRSAIIAKVKSKYWERTHKYGIRIPKNVDEAKRIDADNGNTFWQDAITQEMTNNRIAFQTYDGNPEELVGYEEISGHLIFDVKLSENFRRKARFVADGHLVETPASITYSTVVSRDSVRILLMVAALNGLDIQGCDVQNAFLSANNLEKHWMRAGPEFGAEQGKVFIVVRALYGLKSASAAFRSFIARRLDDMGFKSSHADTDVWLRPAKKPDGSEYYEYVLCYVDDILAISLEATAVLESMKGDSIKFKNDKIAPPEMYLGAKLQKKSINGHDAWTITSVDYINAAVKTIEDTIKLKRWKLRANARTPMSASFIPELDTSPELGPSDITLYQEIIGMLRWAVELGRVDINVEISLLSQYQASPREGHLEQALQIVTYLKNRPKLTLYMDPDHPNIDYSAFNTDVDEFKEYYRDAKEGLPTRMPRARGLPVVTTAFVDASHASNKKTRRSHSGYILFVNRAPVKWYSKRQQTVETSAFSSEFIAMKQCIEDIEHLRFKLRMFGVPLDEQRPQTYVFCDNESLVKNASNLESTLNKKHSSIAYHFTRWNVAARVCTIGWIPTGENLADAMTKRLPEATRDYLFGNWTY